MDQVILFDKSLQKRLQEYTEIFPDFGMNTTEIGQQWRNYLEMTLDPNGWQAVWKIPRSTCESLKILFPTIVLVYIENVSFSDLKAECRIIAVQDDIHLPEFHYVPLMQIWVTKEQDRSVALNINITANVMDMYRFFYTNIFLAWDTDEDVGYDWLGEHLQSRLRLFYDVKNGVIPHAMGEHIKSLVTESRRLQNRRDDLETNIMDHDIDAENTNDKLVEELMELNVNMIEIKNEMDLLENPITRAVILKRQQRSLPGKETDEVNNWLIIEGGKPEDYITLFKMLRNDVNLKVSVSLQAILDTMNPNDTIFLNKNLYKITSSALLQYGGRLKSLFDKSTTTITTTSTVIMFDFTGNVTLENLTINASYTQCAILSRLGKTTLKNCHIIGDGTSTTQQAIIVLSGAELVLIDCIISDFCTAIVGNTGSKVTLENTEIYDVNYGIRMYDECVFKANKSVFRDCQEFGICLETTKMSQGERKVGNYKLLEVIPEVSIRDLNTQNNKNGDVVINQKQKITPIEDLFSSRDDVDEMETTVIEKLPTEAGDNVVVAE